MPFVPAKCTQCGANIEVDTSLEAGVCKYCGTAFITEKAINNYNINVTNNFNGANINVLGGDINNLLTLTQSALDASNYQEAYEYSNKALEINPACAKAWMLKMYAIGAMVTIGEPKVNEFMSYGQKAIQVSTESEKDNIAKDVYTYWINTANAFMTTAVNEISDVSSLIASLCGMPAEAKAQIGMNDTDYRNMIANLTTDAINLALAIPIEYCSEHKDFAEGYIYLADQYLQYCEKDVERIELYNMQLVEASVTGRNSNLNLIKDRIPKEKHDELSGPEIRAGKSGGCYIATAVFGSYDCPEVWTLRRFRDYYLNEHTTGRIFIKCYYAISPWLVSIFGKTFLFNKICRILLNHFVHELNLNGYKSTPYRDKI